LRSKGVAILLLEMTFLLWEGSNGREEPVMASMMKKEKEGRKEGKRKKEKKRKKESFCPCFLA
jgi:hypothetical protein